jgi:simple sugar transport system ATP-binding protein
MEEHSFAPISTGKATKQREIGPGGKPIRARLENITKSFGTIQALKGVDMYIEEGEVLGLVGDNAAGKSTLTKILAGAEIPDRGRIILDGEEVFFSSPADARKRGIEMVYQDLSLCDTIDVAGNLFLGREPVRNLLGIKYLDKVTMHKEAQRMLNYLNIRIQDTHNIVQRLSGGQRQSIAICRAVSFGPKVLIMDEPTAALAVSEVQAVLRLIREVSQQGVSVILITHRLQDLFGVCDRVMVLYEGIKVAERDIEKTNLEEIVRLIVGGGSLSSNSNGNPSSL